MFKKKKIAFSFAIFFALWIISVLYISSAINDEKIRAVATDFVKEQLGELNVEIGQINYSIFPNIKINSETIAITHRKDTIAKVISLKDIEIKLSLATYLLKKGVVDIKATDLYLNYTTGEGNYFKKKPTRKIEKNLGSNLKINFKTENAKINFKENYKDELLVHLSKLIIKGIQIGHNPAFEAVIQLSESKGLDPLQGSLACIGDIDLEKFVYDQTLDLNLFISSENLRVKDKQQSFPEIRVRAKINSEKNNHISAHSTIELGTFFNGAFNLKYSNGAVAISDIDVTMLPNDGAVYLGNILQTTLSNHIKDNNFEVQVTGKLLWDQKQIVPNLKLTSTNNFNFYVSDNYSLKSSLEANIQGHNSSLILRSSAGTSNLVLTMGELNSVLTTQISSDGFELTNKQVQPLMSFLQDLLPQKNHHLRFDNYLDLILSKRRETLKSRILLIDFTNIVIQNINDDKKFSFSANLLSGPKSDELIYFSLISDDGFIKWQKNKNKKYRGQFDVKNFQISDFSHFIANPVSGVNGLLNVKLDTSFTRFNDISLFGEAKISKFAFENFDISKNIKSELEEIGFDSVKLEKSKWPAPIDHLKLYLSLKAEKLEFSKIKFFDSNLSTVLTGNYDKSKNRLLLAMNAPSILTNETKKMFKRNIIPVEILFDETVLSTALVPKINIPLQEDAKI